MSAGSHVALVGLTGLDVDDAVEEVRFAMLPTEVLFLAQRKVSNPIVGIVKRGPGRWRAHPADDVLVVGEVGFAALAAVDLVAGEIRVVC